MIRFKSILPKSRLQSGKKNILGWWVEERFVIKKSGVRFTKLKNIPFLTGNLIMKNSTKREKCDSRDWWISTLVYWWVDGWEGVKTHARIGYCNQNNWFDVRKILTKSRILELYLTRLVFNFLVSKWCFRLLLSMPIRKPNYKILISKIIVAWNFFMPIFNKLP